MNTNLINSVLTASIPTLMVVLAMLLNRSEIGSVRAEIAQLRNQQHTDMLRIYELFGEHGERISRLESRLEHR